MADKTRAKTRKERIMDAALRIFAEKSFQEATIAEISKEAGVSEATIYEYFGTKEDLLFAIPEKISKDTYDEMEAVQPFIRDAEGRIRALMFGYIRLYESNPYYSALVLLQLMSNKRFRQTAAHAAIRKSAHRFIDYIREGIAEGAFRKDVDPYLVRSMLMGSIEHIFIQWHMQGMKKGEKSMTELLDPIVEIIFCGIRAKNEEAGITLHLKMDDARALGHLMNTGRANEKPEHVSEE